MFVVSEGGRNLEFGNLEIWQINILPDSAAARNGVAGRMQAVTTFLRLSLRGKE